MKSICLIVVYFGKEWPRYFPYFLAGCKYNPDINFIFFSNIVLPKALPNVRIVYFSDLDIFNTIASQQLGIDINLVESFKLCDLKPAYGKIFEKYLTGFDFWGYCDIDIILGRVRVFLTDEILEANDVVTVRSEYPAGFFTLYKNVPFVTSLYSYSRDFKAIFQNVRHFCFDECNFKFLELVYNKQHISEVVFEIECMATICWRLREEGRINYYNPTIVQEFVDTKDIHCWEHGSLFNCNTKQEFLLVHLVLLKGLPSFFIENFQGKEIFFISPKGISHLRGISFEYMRKYALTTARNCINVIKWRIRYWLFVCAGVKVAPKDRYIDKLSFALGSSTCTFNFLDGNKIRLDYEQCGVKHFEMGKIYPVKHGLFLYAQSTKIVLIRFLFTYSKPYKVEFLTIRDNRTYMGYLIEAGKRKMP